MFNVSNDVQITSAVNVSIRTTALGHVGLMGLDKEIIRKFLSCCVGGAVFDVFFPPVSVYLSPFRSPPFRYLHHFFFFGSVLYSLMILFPYALSLDLFKHRRVLYRIKKEEVRGSKNKNKKNGNKKNGIKNWEYIVGGLNLRVPSDMIQVRRQLIPEGSFPGAAN